LPKISKFTQKLLTLNLLFFFLFGSGKLRTKKDSLKPTRYNPDVFWKNLRISILGNRKIIKNPETPTKVVFVPGPAGSTLLCMQSMTDCEKTIVKPSVTENCTKQQFRSEPAGLIFNVNGGVIS
jgi:hypothetical protein